MIEWCEEDRQKIERIAYFKWLDAGKPENTGDQFWREAEEQFKNEIDVIEITYPVKKKWDTGYVYAPYIPLSSTVLDPNYDNDIRFVLSDNALKDVFAEYANDWFWTDNESVEIRLTTTY